MEVTSIIISTRAYRMILCKWSTRPFLNVRFGVVVMRSTYLHGEIMIVELRKDFKFSRFNI